ncbi:hypothetical protein [Diaminobutyricimonas sp. LJ205]|uniref:hypothetical protein n=1 Tax=Diaminobutyricimonas sp. LJ205 TaxID=2683590 RepID=UPI0012F4BC42|nr:hypothetical protein [Diaminobutyricimonas sp. LJ205]
MAIRQTVMLTVTDVPLAELSAMRLDGDLFAVDEAFSPIDEFDSPALRAAAIRRGLNERLIAERWSAAWVLGACAPPPRHTFCTRIEARVAHPTALQGAVREVAIEDDECLTIGGLAVTTPLRTIGDLVRFDHDSREAARVAATVTALLEIGELSVAECIASLERRPHLPFKRRAVQRLLAQPEETR